MHATAFVAPLLRVFMKIRHQEFRFKYSYFQQNSFKDMWLKDISLEKKDILLNWTALSLQFIV